MPRRDPALELLHADLICSLFDIPTRIPLAKLQEQETRKSTSEKTHLKKVVRITNYRITLDNSCNFYKVRFYLRSGCFEL